MRRMTKRWSMTHALAGLMIWCSPWPFIRIKSLIRFRSKLAHGGAWSGLGLVSVAQSNPMWDCVWSPVYISTRVRRVLWSRELCFSPHLIPWKYSCRPSPRSWSCPKINMNDIAVTNLRTLALIVPTRKANSLSAFLNSGKWSKVCSKTKRFDVSLRTQFVKLRIDLLMRNLLCARRLLSGSIELKEKLSPLWVITPVAGEQSTSCSGDLAWMQFAASTVQEAALQWPTGHFMHQELGQCICGSIAGLFEMGNNTRCALRQ